MISVKIDRKRKLPITALLRAFGFDEKRLREEFADIDTSETKFIENTLLKTLLIIREKPIAKSTSDLDRVISLPKKTPSR